MNKNITNNAEVVADTTATQTQEKVVKATTTQVKPSQAVHNVNDELFDMTPEEKEEQALALRSTEYQVWKGLTEQPRDVEVRFIKATRYAPQTVELVVPIYDKFRKVIKNERRRPIISDALAQLLAIHQRNGVKILQLSVFLTLVKMIAICVSWVQRSIFQVMTVYKCHLLLTNSRLWKP